MVTIARLKGNQPQMHADVVARFADARSALQPAYGMRHATTIDTGHGRIEQRQALVISDPSVIAYLNDQDRWTGLRSVVVIESERTLNCHRQYELSSECQEHFWAPMRCSNTDIWLDYAAFTSRGSSI